MLGAGYLGDLGGLSRRRTLVVLDLRGTGESGTPQDVSSYRCDRLVGDVEALREHVGLGRLDLLGHSAGANLAVLYAARYPERVGKLALIGPSPRAVGVEVRGEARRELARLREDEPWFPAAFAALEALTEGRGTGPDGAAVAPFFWGRWDAATQRQNAAVQAQRNDAAARVFGSDGAFDPQRTRAALAHHKGPVLILTGEFDLNTPPETAAEIADLFPDATTVVQPGAGHYPWFDDADRFVATTAAFLS